MRYYRLLDANNSNSHLGEFVARTYACWERRVQYGTDNVTNPGRVTAREVVGLISKYGIVDKEFQFFEDETDFMAKATKAPRSNYVMAPSKLGGVAIYMTPVVESIELCLNQWEFSANE